jgi:hypothetical protein
MNRAFTFLILIILIVLPCACRTPAATRVAVTSAVPPADDEKALVIFMFPPCARYEGIPVNAEEAMLCRKGRRNRIRVVERGARLVTDIGVDQYGASYEEPGRHLYAAFHHGDHCTMGRADCIAALKANLLPGKVYIVTFRWNYFTTSGGRGGLRLQYGRLEITPVSAEREPLFRARLAELERVEPIPGFHERGMIGELRTSYVSNHVLERVAQDKKDGVATPVLGGRSWVEELDENGNPIPTEKKPEEKKPEDKKPEEDKKPDPPPRKLDVKEQQDEDDDG